MDNIYVELVDKRHIVIRAVNKALEIRATNLHFHTPEEARHELDSFLSKQQAEEGVTIQQFDKNAYGIIH